MQLYLNIVIWSFVVLNLLFLSTIIIFVTLLLRPKRVDHNKAFTKETSINGINKDWCLYHKRIDLLYRINTKHYLNGNIFYKENLTDKFVFCIHGYGYNRIGMLKYVDMLNDCGFNVVVYDLRGLGISSGRIITMGDREKEDLHLLVEYIKANYQVALIGFLGVSLGATTALLCQQKYFDASFIIADCGFADLRILIKNKIKAKLKFFPVNLFLFFSQIIIYLIASFTYKKVSPLYKIDLLENTPILFIHGINDKVIDEKQSEKMFMLKKGRKELLLIENAVHAGAIIANKELYQNKVVEFIKSIIK